MKTEYMYMYISVQKNGKEKKEKRVTKTGHFTRKVKKFYKFLIFFLVICTDKFSGKISSLWIKLYTHLCCIRYQIVFNLGVLV